MAQDPNPSDLEARMTALEARVAALEAKVLPGNVNVCIYAGQEYTEGAVLVQGNVERTCSREFLNSPLTWR